MKMQSSSLTLSRFKATHACIVACACSALLPFQTAQSEAADMTSTWITAAGVWSVSTNWSTPFFPQNGNGGFTYDAILGNGGSITLDSTQIIIQDFSLQSGQITGTSATGFVRATQNISIAAGTINGHAVISAQNGLVFTTGGTVYLQDTANIANSGAAGGWDGIGKTVYGYNSAVITNAAGGTFTVSGNGALTVLSGTPVFNNAGSFIKNTDSGTFDSGFAFNNSGSVSVQAGTVNLSGGGVSSGSFAVSSTAALSFSGGSHSLTAGAQINGPGITSVGIGGTVSIDGTVTGSGTLNLNGGSITGTGSHTATIGNYQLTTGSVQGTAQLTSGTGAGKGALFTTNGTVYLQENSMITNAGAAGGWDGAGKTVYGYNSAVITNAAGGTFTVSGSGALTVLSGTPVFNNAGSFIKNTDAGSLDVGFAFNNTGSVSVQTGTLNLSGGGASTGSFAVTTALNFSGGNHSLTTGAQINGAGITSVTIGGTLSIDGTVSGNGTLNLNGGLITGTGGNTATIEKLEFSTGTVQGTHLTSGATTGVYFPTNGTVYLQNDSVITNAGNGAGWSGIGKTVYGYDNATITNAAGGTFTVSGTGALSVLSGNPVFNNAGNFIKNASAGAFDIGFAFNNTGFVQVGSGGSLNLSGGGSATGAFTVVSGSALNFAGGTYSFDAPQSGTPVYLFGPGHSVTGGTVSIDGPVWGIGANAVLNLNGGTISGTGGNTANLDQFLFSTGTVQGTAHLTSGTGAGEGAHFTTNGTVYLQNSSVITNAGAAGGWDGLGKTVYGYDSAVITNTSGATFTVSGNGALTVLSGTPVFNNAGTFLKNTDTGTFDMGFAFNNTGSVSVQKGVLTLDNVTQYDAANTTLTGGSWAVSDTGAGATLAGAGIGAVTTNMATVSLSGVNSLFSAMDALASNKGHFSISNGRNFATPGALANSGTLAAGSGTAFTVNGALTQSATGTLAGAGAFAATAFTLDGTVSPGDSPGTLTLTGATTFDSTLNLAFELGSLAGTNDHLHITGNFTLDGTLDITALAGFGAGVYDLVDYSGGTFTDHGLVVGTAPAGYTYQIVTNIPGQVDLNVQGVPEPSAWTLVALGVPALLGFRRFGRRSV